MSVKDCTYVLYGFEFDWNTYMNKYSDKFYELDLDAYVVLDGMSGEYLYIGVILANMGYDDVEKISLSFDTISKRMNSLMAELKEKVPDFYHDEDIKSKEFDIHVFRHFY